MGSIFPDHSMGPSFKIWADVYCITNFLRSPVVCEGTIVAPRLSHRTPFVPLKMVYITTGFTYEYIRMITLNSFAFVLQGNSICTFTEFGFWNLMTEVLDRERYFLSIIPPSAYGGVGK